MVYHSLIGLGLKLTTTAPPTGKRPTSTNMSITIHAQLGWSLLIHSAALILINRLTWRRILTSKVCCKVDRQPCMYMCVCVYVSQSTPHFEGCGLHYTLSLHFLCECPPLINGTYVHLKIPPCQSSDLTHPYCLP